MKTCSKITLVLLALAGLAGCQHNSSAVGSDGRPHAPSGQAVPGGTLGSGPVGQPQS
ncbi:hypothetical protein ACQPT2_02430 [Erwinia amylovora]